MTTKQKALIKRAIKKDCKTQYKYCNGKGETCAVGALILSVITKRHKLWRLVRKYNRRSIYAFELKPVVELLNKKLGLQRDDLGKVQWANDNHGTPKERQVAILEKLNL